VDHTALDPERRLLKIWFQSARNECTVWGDLFNRSVYGFV